MLNNKARRDPQDNTIRYDRRVQRGLKSRVWWST